MDAIIFDIDGVLADNTHREHYLKIKPRNWPAFFKAQVNDPCIECIAHICRGIYEMQRGKLAVVVCTARPDNYKDATESWFKKMNLKYDALYMREAKDNRCDSIVKAELLDKMKKDGYNPLYAFEDRPRVVRMYERNGVLCFPCANINEEF